MKSNDHTRNVNHIAAGLPIVIFFDKINRTRYSFPDINYFCSLTVPHISANVLFIFQLYYSNSKRIKTKTTNSKKLTERFLRPGTFQLRQLRCLKLNVVADVENTTSIFTSAYITQLNSTQQRARMLHEDRCGLFSWTQVLCFETFNLHVREEIARKCP